MNRRRFLSASGAVGLTGLAGCSTLRGGDETALQDVQFETPTALLEELYGRMASASVHDLVHSDVKSGATTTEGADVRLDVVDEALAPGQLVELADLPEAEARELARNSVVTVVDATVEFDWDVGTDEMRESWVLATDGGNWQVVDRVDSSVSALLTRPRIRFAFDYQRDADLVTITPISGDRVPALELVVDGGAGTEYVGRLTDVEGSGYVANERIEIGREIEIPVRDDSFVITIVWHSDKSCSCQLERYTGPNFE